MMPCVYGSARLLGLTIGWAIAAQVVVSLLVAAATAWAFGRTRDAPQRALLIASGTVLVSPYTFNYDLTALTAAVLWVVAAMPALEARERILFGLTWIVPVLVWPLHLYRIGVAPLILGGVFII